MVSLTRWTWVWVDSGSWWWTGKPGMLQSMGSQRVEHKWATELNWTDWVGDNNITLMGFQKGSVAQMQVGRKKTVALDFWQVKQIGGAYWLGGKSNKTHWKIRSGQKSSLMNRQNMGLTMYWESCGSLSTIKMYLQTKRKGAYRQRVKYLRHDYVIPVDN